MQPRQVRKAEERVCNPRSCHHLGVCASTDHGTIIIVAASTDHLEKVCGIYRRRFVMALKVEMYFIPDFAHHPKNTIISQERD